MCIFMHSTLISVIAAAVAVTTVAGAVASENVSNGNDAGQANLLRREVPTSTFSGEHDVKSHRKIERLAHWAERIERHDHARDAREQSLHATKGDELPDLTLYDCTKAYWKVHEDETDPAKAVGMVLVKGVADEILPMEAVEAIKVQNGAEAIDKAAKVECNDHVQQFQNGVAIARGTEALFILGAVAVDLFSCGLTGGTATMAALSYTATVEVPMSVASAASTAISIGRALDTYTDNIAKLEALDRKCKSQASLADVVQVQSSLHKAKNAFKKLISDPSKRDMSATCTSSLDNDLNTCKDGDGAKWNIK
jgi:hypothetical protein